MSNATQVYSWLENNQWGLLLAHFNKQESSADMWTTLFGQVRRYGIQEQWPHCLDFVQKLLHHKTRSHGSPTSAQQQRSFQNAWAVLRVAVPNFLVPAVELLTPPQRDEFVVAVGGWMNTWMQLNRAKDMRERMSMVATAFQLYCALDAFEEWCSIEPQLISGWTPSLVTFTSGRDIRWANALRERDIKEGGDLDGWGMSLLRNNCMEHLQKSPVSFPVSRSFLLTAKFETGHRSIPFEKAVHAVFDRYPAFRRWLEHNASDDAQTCRSILDMHNPSPECTLAQAMTIGKSLGLSWDELVNMLDAPDMKQTFLVDHAVFETNP